MACHVPAGELFWGGGNASPNCQAGIARGLVTAQNLKNGAARGEAAGAPAKRRAPATLILECSCAVPAGGGGAAQSARTDSALGRVRLLAFRDSMGAGVMFEAGAFYLAPVGGR
jgi:hypothetical protein